MREILCFGMYFAKIPEMADDASSTSKWSEKPLVTHVCIICSQQFQQKQPQLQFAEDLERKIQLNESSKILDEFGIFFGLQCLKLSVGKIEELFGNLIESVGEPGVWGVSFCQRHAELMKKAFEMKQLMKRLQSQLDNMQLILTTEISEDIQKEGQAGRSGKNVAFKIIRKEIQSVINCSHSSSATGSKNKFETDGRRKRKVKRTPAAAAAAAAGSPLSEAGDVTSIKAEPRSLDQVDLNVVQTPTKVRNGVELPKVEDEGEQEWKDTEEEDGNHSPKRRKKNYVSIRNTRLKTRNNATPRKKLKQKTTAKVSDSNRFNVHCKFCSLAFTALRDRDNHIRNVHGGSKVYACRTCGMSYANLNSLRNHENVEHRTSQEFYCKYCPKIYKSNKDLSVHIRENHSATATELLFCPHCGKGYTGRYTLRRHIHNVHQDSSPIHDERGEVFADDINLKKRNLSQHKNTFSAHGLLGQTIAGTGNATQVNVNYKSYSNLSLSAAGSPQLTSPPFISPISPSENIQLKIQQMLKGPVSYKCYQCGDEFSTSVLINRHKRICNYIAF